MAIADLALRPGSALTAESTSAPDNGVNTFAIGIERVNVPDDDNLEITVIPLGTSVTAWSYVPASLDLSVDPPRISMNFTQGGSDQVRLIVRQLHTITR